MQYHFQKFEFLFQLRSRSQKVHQHKWKSTNPTKKVFLSLSLNKMHPTESSKLKYNVGEVLHVQIKKTPGERCLAFQAILDRSVNKPKFMDPFLGLGC